MARGAEMALKPGCSACLERRGPHRRFRAAGRRTLTVSDFRSGTLAVVRSDKPAVIYFLDGT
jgi:hypothetical protein